MLPVRYDDDDDDDDDLYIVTVPKIFIPGREFIFARVKSGQSGT